MKNRSYIAWIIFGAVLIISALLLVFINMRQDEKSGKAARQILPEVLEIISENYEKNQSETDIGIDEDLLSEYKQPDNEEEPEETIVTKDGREYIGVVTIPAINVELPVQSSWSYNNLDVSPCRYSGTVSDGNLVIAAHNYRSFFRNLDSLDSGDEIVFTDANGINHFYSVVQTELINGRDVSKMDENSDDWDLTLFTCNYSGYSRVTVRAVEIEK